MFNIPINSTFNTTINLQEIDDTNLTFYKQKKKASLLHTTDAQLSPSIKIQVVFLDAEADCVQLQ